MAANIIQLPAGTEHAEIVPVPINLTWCGTVRARLTTHTAAATIHSWEFINVSENDAKIRYRRVGLKGAHNFYNIPLAPETDVGWWLAGAESLVKFVYTSTYPLTFMFETTFNQPTLGQLAVPTTQWNKQADAKPWVTNVTAGNPTENHINDGTRDVLGVLYWKPRP